MAAVGKHDKELAHLEMKCGRQTDLTGVSHPPNDLLSCGTRLHVSPSHYHHLGFVPLHDENRNIRPINVTSQTVRVQDLPHRSPSRTSRTSLDIVFVRVFYFGSIWTPTTSSAACRKSRATLVANRNKK